VQNYKAIGEGKKRLKGEIRKAHLWTSHADVNPLPRRARKEHALKKSVLTILLVFTLGSIGIAVLAQHGDDLPELRRELIERIETAYTNGDSATLWRMVETERRLERLNRGESPFVTGAVGADIVAICPQHYSYSPTRGICSPASTSISAAPVHPFMLTVPSGATGEGPSSVNSAIFLPLPPPGLGPPAISPPNVNINCTVQNPEVLAAAQACSAAEAEICNSGTAAQCQAKGAECAAIWASVSLDCSG